MYFLVYASSAVKPLTTAELRALLAKSRANNEKNGITGMLLYRDGSFMQALEGPEAAVKATYSRISRDPRHRGLIVLLSGEWNGRQFEDFSMGFHDLDAAESRKVPGFSEFLNTPLTDEEFAGAPTRAQKLLLTFKKVAGPL